MKTIERERSQKEGIIRRGEPEIKALKDSKNKIIMDWNAKAGCTVCVKMFFRNMGILQKALDYSASTKNRKWVHDYRPIFYKSNGVTKEDLEDPSYFKFKVARNPYSRVISSYIFAMKGQYVDEEIMKVLKLKTKDISFSQFITYLSKIDLETCNQHHELQKKRYEKESSPFDYIAKLENIDEEIKNINKLAGTHFSLDGLSSTHHASTNNDIQKNVSNEPWSKIKDQIPNYKYFYNPELIKKVGRIYKEDIEEYGYSFDDFIKTYSDESYLNKIKKLLPTKQNQFKDSNKVAGKKADFVLFEHFPKTGGTSIKIILEDFCKRHNISISFDYGEEHKFTNFDPKNPTKVIYGHKVNSEFSEYLPNNSAYIHFTMLRHPFDWIISRYFYGTQLGHFDKMPKNKIGKHLVSSLPQDFFHLDINGFWKPKYKNNYRYTPLLTEEFKDSLKIMLTILNNVLGLKLSDHDIANEVMKYEDTHKNEGTNKHNKSIDIKSISQINKFIYESGMDIVYSESKNDFLNLKNRIETKSKFDDYIMNTSEPASVPKVELKINRSHKKSNKYVIDPKNNKKKLYLHIGVHKTGSTSIQRFIRNNKEQLLKAGVFIPLLEDEYRHDNYGNNHVNLAWEIRNNNQFDPKKATWKKFITDYQNSDCQKAVISTEALDGMKESEIVSLYRLLRDHFDTTIICYLRRQDRLVNSEYCQAVKTGLRDFSFKVKLNLVHKIDQYNFKSLLDRWSDIFSRERVKPRIFEKEQFINGNLIDDFLDACDIPPDIIEDKEKNIIMNPAPNRTSILAALEANRILENSYKNDVIENKEIIIRKVVDHFNKIKDNTHFFGFNNKKAKNFLNQYNESNSAVARKYFSRNNGQLFLDNKPLNPNQESSDDRILSAEQLKVIQSIIAEGADQIGNQ
ncbi:sulfotransferase family protein [Patescibacteria group bacterium]|nr:sulfotransferase family protein [Patescibacteria group bacterium]